MDVPFHPGPDAAPQRTREALQAIYQRVRLGLATTGEREAALLLDGALARMRLAREPEEGVDARVHPPPTDWA